MVLTEAQLDQRRRALRSANNVRTKRAEVKIQLLEGTLSLEQLIWDPPVECEGATIGEVLTWVPGIGNWRAKRILAPGSGAPGVGRDVELVHLSPASKRRIIVRYEEIRPWRYPQPAVAA